ncbi:MAG: hypothetical protein QOD77_894 [Thermoplasmata archaeon]|jgi:hypothetical protein|nr:hypothetical protein [Thermoplasmata archaeon]
MMPPRAAGPWDHLVALLSHPLCQGAGPLQLVAREPFWDDRDLPFEFEGGGTICRVIPQRGFRKESLAGSEDERLLIVDCPDDDGWLVPEDLVADWMARNVSHAELDDLLLSHPLYEYLTKPDEHGHSRGGRGDLVQWAPGIPTIASLAAPEFLPDDEDAPAIHRDRKKYAKAVLDLMRKLDRRFDLLEIEVGLRFGLGMQAEAPDP